MNDDHNQQHAQPEQSGAAPRQPSQQWPPQWPPRGPGRRLARRAAPQVRQPAADRVHVLIRGVPEACRADGTQTCVHEPGDTNWCFTGADMSVYPSADIAVGPIGRIATLEELADAHAALDAATVRIQQAIMAGERGHDPLPILRAALAAPQHAAAITAPAQPVTGLSATTGAGPGTGPGADPGAGTAHIPVAGPVNGDQAPDHDRDTSPGTSRKVRATDRPTDRRADRLGAGSVPRMHLAVVPGGDSCAD